MNLAGPLRAQLEYLLALAQQDPDQANALIDAMPARDAFEIGYQCARAEAAGVWRLGYEAGQQALRDAAPPPGEADDAHL